MRIFRARATGAFARLTGVGLAAALALSACQFGGSGAGGSSSAVPSAAPAAITVQPGNGATGVLPDAPVTISAAGGTLSTVTVTDSKGRALPGKLSSDARTWTLSSPLMVGGRYTVAARAHNEQGASSALSTSFSTVRPKAVLTTSVSPLSGSTVGVGMPVVVRFSDPVRDRAAVQHALSVETSRKIVGAWSWISDEEVQYRPRTYWPTNTRVRVGIDLQNVDAGGGVWGAKNRVITFSTTRSALVSTVDVKSLRMTVRRNGEVVRVIPVTTGKDGFLTRGGIKVISEKHRTKIMDASTVNIARNSREYYRLRVEYALRVTWSGEFVHAAPWSVGQQGSANVSHGCVGMSMADGKWFFDQSSVGDVVKVVNSPRTLEAGNGYTAWNVPWSTWVKGSAL